MHRKIYLLELVEFYYCDKNDGEDVEDRWIIGYFTQFSKLEEYLKNCFLCKKNSEKVVVTPFEVDINYNQKYIYILSYEYTYLIDGHYVDYSYVFEPQRNYTDCMELMNRIKMEDKYSHNDEKIYDENSKLGFFVEKYELNCCYYSLEEHRKEN